MKTFDELVEGIKELKERGFVKTHRSNDTGIGKTLEDLLGIKENNFAGPDGQGPRKQRPGAAGCANQSGSRSVRVPRHLGPGPHA